LWFLSQEARKPGSQEARKPGSQEARKPGSQEARKPGSVIASIYFMWIYRNGVSLLSICLDYGITV
jgi:hypothetical protein